MAKTLTLQEQMDALERISAGYAATFGFERDLPWFMLKLQEEVGELTQAFLMSTGSARTKGQSAEQIRDNLGAELADVYCHTLLLARHLGVDLEAAIQQKWLRRS